MCIRDSISISGQDLLVVHDLSQPTIKTSLSLNCSKAEREINWKPRTSIDDGITKTIEWWKDNIKSI